MSYSADPRGSESEHCFLYMPYKVLKIGTEYEIHDNPVDSIVEIILFREKISTSPLYKKVCEQLNYIIC